MEKYYSNSALIRASLFDFTITFNRITEMQPDKENEPVVEVAAIVQMSPQHAKALLSALSSNVARWEKNFGEIKLPAEKDGSDKAKAATDK